jgi:hypothetical protein
MNRLALRGSLRIRLLAGTVFWVAASIIVAGWGLGSLFRQHVAKQFHAELQTHLDQLTAHLALDEQGRPTLSMPLSDLRLNRPYSGLYWQIDDLAGAGAAAVGTLRSRSLWDYVLTAPVDAPADGEVHRHRLSGPAGTMLGMIERSVRLDDRPEVAAREFRLIVAADERLMVEPAARVNGALWLALGVLATGLVIAALVQVFVGLSPLRTLRAALGRVRNGDAQRLEGEFPVEIAPLVGEFNSVLEQNAEVVQRARTQAGNLAHALKTPLSLLANAAAGGDGELARLVIAPRSMPRKNRCTTTWRGPRRLPRSAPAAPRCDRCSRGCCGRCGESTPGGSSNCSCIHLPNPWPSAARSRISRRCSATCSTTPASGLPPASRFRPASMEKT